MFSADPVSRTPWNPNWVTKQFVAARRQAGLGHFRLHNLRHFMATQMLNDGVSVVTVAQRLSHARNSTTFNHYAHAVPSSDSLAAEALSAMLDGPQASGGNLLPTGPASRRLRDRHVADQREGRWCPGATARSTGRGPSALASGPAGRPGDPGYRRPLSATAMGHARVMGRYLIGLVPRQATLARNEMARSSSLSVCRLRQAM